VFGVAVVLACLLGVLTVVRLAAAVAYLRSARLNRSSGRLAGPLPHVSVLLPLRGVDPSLKQTIREVLRQDYPNFDLWIVVDSRQDPGWQAVQEVLQELDAPNIHVRELTHKRSNCSLLCSTVLQFLEEVDGRTDLIAFCASDGIVPRGWLRHMVAALQDPKVGSTLGSRWYAPPRGRWGSLVRYLWNVSATVYMWRYKVPWSGAIILRLDDIRRSGLPDRWARAMIEDAHVGQILSRIGLDVKFVPELIVLNRDETSLRDCFRFLVRQFFWTQVYHSSYAAILTIVLLTGLTTVAPLLFVPLALWAGQWASAALVGGALLGQVALLLGMLPVLDRHVLQCSGFGVESSCLTWRTWLKLPVAVVLTQIVSLLAVVAAAFVRVVDWRGIRYRVEGPWKCTMLEYVPYSASSAGLADANATDRAA